MDYKVLLGDTPKLLSETPDNSVELVVTSPPYIGAPIFWGIDWHATNAPRKNEWLGSIWDECIRILKPGCKLIVNVANTRRRPYMSNVYELYNWNKLSQPKSDDHKTRLYELYTQRDVLLAMAGDDGLVDEKTYNTLESLSSKIAPLLYKSEPLGEIIWDKGMGQNGTAWGSFRSPSDISLADQHEYIVVFRKFGERHRPDEFEKIDTTDFKSWRNSIWRIPPAKASKLGHVAPFPIELPRRLITLYTFPGETVLDPFCGKGTTGQACAMLGRNFIGFDHNPEYVELSLKNIHNTQADLGQVDRQLTPEISQARIFSFS